MVLSGTTLTAGPAAADPYPPIRHTHGTAVVYSQPGDYIGQGQPHLYYAPGNAGMSVTNDDAWVQVVTRGGSMHEPFTFTFYPPTGEHLHTGLYDHTLRFPEPGRPGMDVYGGGRGRTPRGRFDVQSIRFDSKGQIVALHVTFEENCGEPPALFGEVDIHGGPLPSSVIAPSSLWWPDTYPGLSAPSVPVWVINTGDASLHMGTAALAGLDAFRLLRHRGRLLGRSPTGIHALPHGRHVLASIAGTERGATGAERRAASGRRSNSTARG